MLCFDNTVVIAFNIPILNVTLPITETRVLCVESGHVETEPERKMIQIVMRIN